MENLYEMIELMLKMTVTIFSAMNPFGAIPLYLSLTQDQDEDSMRGVRRACSIAVTITLIISMFIGETILSFFGISIASFRVGGGIVIFLMALSMVRAKNSDTKINKKEVEEQKNNPTETGIVPLAIPLLAGPGAISTIIVHTQHFADYTYWIAATMICIGFGLLVFTILYNAKRIGDTLGVLGLNVFTRLMGLILLALSIEMMLGGLKEFLLD